MVAKRRNMEKSALCIPLDVASATSAAQQWNGIGFDPANGNFKVWYKRKYIASRWTLDDAISVMVHTITEREKCACDRASLWVGPSNYVCIGGAVVGGWGCFSIDCGVGSGLLACGTTCHRLFCNVTQAGAGEAPPGHVAGGECGGVPASGTENRGAEEAAPETAEGAASEIVPECGVGDPDGCLGVVAEFQFWDSVYSGLLPEDLGDLVRRRVGQPLSTPCQKMKGEGVLSPRLLSYLVVPRSSEDVLRELPCAGAYSGDAQIWTCSGCF